MPAPGRLPNNLDLIFCLPCLAPITTIRVVTDTHNFDHFSVFRKLDASPIMTTTDSNRFNVDSLDCIIFGGQMYEEIPVLAQALLDGDIPARVYD